MTEKLHPPYIEGSIPARYGDILKVPFMMNSSVDKEKIVGFRAKIKSLVSKNNNDTLFTVSTFTDENGKELFNQNYENYIKEERNAGYVDSIAAMLENHIAEFNLLIPQKAPEYIDENKKIVEGTLKIGQYYKVQLAFQSLDGKGNVQDGNFSTVGIFKWTTNPKIGIKGFDKEKINPSSYQYIGTYEQINRTYKTGGKVYTFSKDSTEKVEKYRFALLNSKKQVVEETGWQIHDSSTDGSIYSSYDIFEYSRDIPQNEVYYIQYQVITNNNLKPHAMRYKIKAAAELEPEEKMSVLVENNAENGYVKISLKNEDNSPAWGTFRLLRKDIGKKYEWEEITKFVLDGKKPSTWSWKDFTVEHNKTYTYAYQQYLDNSEGKRLFSYKIESQPITANFDHMFLWDGKQQLKVCFDPKVSSFKTVKMESKIETIGSKYPFFFRNGRISYKDFPIAGLLSYWSDDENLFASNELLIFDDDGMDISKVRSIDLTDSNYHKERNFKTQVLNWLNDGKVKLFRSPSEGNFLVRLMNISLSPNETVGRMLHTFSCNAYEVDSFSYEHLLEYGFLDTSEEKFNDSRKIQMWASVGEKDYNIEKHITINTVKFYQIKKRGDFTSLKIEGFKPGVTFAIKQGKESNPIVFTIGATGSYNLDDLIPCTHFYICEKDCSYTDNDNTVLTIPQGTITYGYEKEFKNNFGAYEDIEEFVEVPARIITLSDTTKNKDIVNFISDVKTQIVNISYIKFMKDIHNLSYDNNNEELKLYDINFSFPNSEQLYLFIEKGEEKYIPKNEFSFKFTIDGNEIDITDTEIYILNSLDNIKDMKINLGLGVKAQIGYSANIVEYIFETEYDTTEGTYKPVEAKNKVIEAKNAYFNFDPPTGVESVYLLPEQLEKYNEHYDSLIKMLEKQITIYKEQGGIV